jgi:ABC-type nitrate/sulfonate/bicarbonate transport system substrate-binding protein
MRSGSFTARFDRAEREAKMFSLLYWIETVFILLAVITASSVPVAAASLERINASYGAISGSMAPIWVAKEARLFEKQGLDLNLVYISGGPRSIMSLICGSVQFVNHSGSRPWKPIKGAPPRR